ncbi:MAG: M14 family metallopeptidase [Gemmatimonadota bacterium]
MSSELDPQPEPQRISEADVRRVLERAIQLDAARAGETTVAELHRVAQELNITPASISQALRELQSKQVEVAPRPAPLEADPQRQSTRTEKILDWMRMGLIAVGAQIIARSINYADGDDVAAFLSIIATIGVGSAVLYRLAKKPAETYLRDLAVFWGLFTLTWLMDPPVDREWVFPGNHYIVQGLGIIPLVGAIFSWLASSTVGGFFMRLKWPWKKVDAKQGFAATASLFVFMACLPAFASAQRITSPKEQFGHNFGDDYFLANYKQLAEYWHKLDAESDRMIVKEIGKTAEGRPHLMAIVTSPENHRNLARYQDISRRLGFAEGLTDAQARALAKEGKAVVWIDGGLHASESLGAQQLGETVYQFVSSNDEETLRLLNDVVILFMHANPDGNDLIADWYMRRSNPQERVLGGYPRLYQKYIGHDNNRDFFGSTQAETENMNRVLYHEWLPQLLYNHHQSGPAGTVFWSPPLRDPYNYNLHPMLVLGFQSLGAAMHTRMAAEGKPGATMRSGGPYDGWWNGGIRNTAAFHNVIALLTEMIGSPTPMRIPFVAQRQIPGSDLAYPIEPQEWHFRQSVDYSVSLNKAVLDYAARFRENLLYNIYVMGKSSIDRGSKDYWTVNPRRIAEVTARLGGGGGRGGGGGAGGGTTAQRDSAIMAELRKPEHRDPRGYIIPSSQPDFPTAVKFVNALREVNITVHKATRDFDVAGKNYPAGSLVVFTAQAFRPHVIDMFEPQHHPDVFPVAGGPPTPPYDNAGWTFAYQMGVQFDRILEPFSGPFEKVSEWNLPMPVGMVTGTGPGFLFDRRVNNSFIAVNRLQKANEQVSTLTQPFNANGKIYPAGTFYVRSRGNTTRTVLNRLAQETGVSFEASPPPTPTPTPLRTPRVGLWDQFGGSMDAGWARWILEQFEYSFDRVFPPQLDAGNLNAKYDVLIFVGGGIPSAGRGGGGGRAGGAAPATDIPAEYQAQVGQMSADKTLPQIEQFIRNGGTVITIGSSATNLAAFLKLPLEDHLVENGTPLNSTKFYVPGSVLSARVDTSHPVALGMTEYTNVFFDDSPVFRAGPGITTIARFDTDTPLRSGWAWGQKYLENGVVAAEAKVGNGRVLFFGPEILKRAQPHPTFKFLFNGIITSTSSARIN